MKPYLSLYLLASFSFGISLTGCKPADPNADARQAAKDRLAAGNRHEATPGTTFLHHADQFPVSFPRELTGLEKKLVGTWEGNGDSMFAEGPTKYLVQLNGDGSGEIIIIARMNPATNSHEWPLNLWNGGPRFPWQVDGEGLLQIPHTVAFTYSVKGRSLVLTSDDDNARIKTMKLIRLK